MIRIRVGFLRLVLTPLDLRFAPSDLGLAHINLMYLDLQLAPFELWLALSKKLISLDLELARLHRTRSRVRVGVGVRARVRIRDKHRHNTSKIDAKQTMLYYFLSLNKASKLTRPLTF